MNSSAIISIKLASVSNERRAWRAHARRASPLAPHNRTFTSLRATALTVPHAALLPRWRVAYRNHVRAAHQTITARHRACLRSLRLPPCACICAFCCCARRMVCAALIAACMRVCIMRLWVGCARAARMLLAQHTIFASCAHSRHRLSSAVLRAAIEQSDQRARYHRLYKRFFAARRAPPPWLVLRAYLSSRGCCSASDGRSYCARLRHCAPSLRAYCAALVYGKKHQQQHQRQHQQQHGRWHRHGGRLAA